MTLPISVVVLAKNEEAGLATTLSHLTDFAQVIVVDSSSTDRTVQIARDFGATVINFIWDGLYPKKKQWSLDNAGATMEWVLLLDADEYPSPELVGELTDLFKHGIPVEVGAYDLELSYRFAGQLLQRGHRVIKRSLLRPVMTRFPDINDLEAPGIREVEGHYQPQTPMQIRRLKGRLVHDDRDPVSSWFDRHNRYSDWEAYLQMFPAARREVASKRSGPGRIFDRVPLKPLVFFLYGYLIKLGAFDGRAGFDYHFALAVYYWQIGVKVREQQRAGS